MLVLSRKPGETIVIGGGIKVTVLEVKGNKLRLGIEAPPEVRVMRGELATNADGCIVVCSGDYEPAAPGAARPSRGRRPGL